MIVHVLFPVEVVVVAALLLHQKDGEIERTHNDSITVTLGPLYTKKSE